MINIYKYLGIILIPIIRLNILLRLKNNKEIKSRFKERYGVPSHQRPQKKLIWIHAASIGEFKSADIIIENFHKKYTILVTTTTVSAAKIAKENYGNKIIHQFAPLDVSLWINKFLLFWNPSLVIWIESDIWPLTMHTINKQKIKSILVNVRLSPKSYKRWKRFSFFYKQITNCFSEIFAQSELDKKRISELTNRKVQFIGNLKLAKINKNKVEELDRSIFSENKTIIISFVSTHEGEESLIIPVIKKLIKSFNNVKFIIAPRHPERNLQLVSTLQKNNVNYALEDNLKNKNYELLVVNSFGNLPKYFKVSDIVFLGGSIKSKGGHNPIEPAQENCAIITGPYIYNWQNIYEEMLNYKACIIIKKTEELENKLKYLINNKEDLNIIKKNAYVFSQKKFFNSQYLFESIKKKLSNVEST